MRVPTLCAFVLAAAVLTGCTSNHNVAPPPRVTTEPTTSSETPRPTEAPPIETPVDLTPYHRQTCALLTPEQTAVLRFSPTVSNGATPETGRCGWRTVSDRTANYALTVFMTGDPLGDVYRRSNDRYANGKRVWEPFEIQTIDGLPAVVTVMGDPSTYCEVTIGTGGGQGILLFASLSPERADPELCDRLVTAAGWVVDAARN